MPLVARAGSCRVRLVTPPGGVVLDPFLGSGTTAVAAILEGFEWKGCELTEDYLPIIKGRVEHARAAVRKAQQQAAEAAASEQASGGAAECASAA